MGLKIYSSQKPWLNLICLFVFWKFLLLSIALLSPGPGYDTSTQLLFDGEAHAALDRGSHHAASLPTLMAEKLTRWDGIYFASNAQYGYVLEQEWAFSWAFTRLMKLLAFGLSSDPQQAIVTHALSGIIIANVSHLLAVLVLYRLVHILTIHYRAGHGDRVAFLAAALHIISPAGMFLSAPYGESTFALLNFLGMLFYVSASHAGTQFRAVVNMLLAGLTFGAAATIRGNGLLSGAILAIDFLLLIGSLRGPQRKTAKFIQLGATGLSGVLLAIGFILPQAVAYLEYCVPASGVEPRPWCHYVIPSIYSWVQDHYWNVGFLRYWTLSNLPLFLLATPSLFFMLSTAVQVFKDPSPYDPGVVPLARVDFYWSQDLFAARDGSRQLSKKRYDLLRSAAQQFEVQCLRHLAMPQALLALLTFTNFHVQIITRISSGYPVWYFVLAKGIVEKRPFLGGIKPKWVVRWTVMYLLVQGGLFASFLPPA